MTKKLSFAATAICFAWTIPLIPLSIFTLQWILVPLCMFVFVTVVDWAQLTRDRKAEVRSRPDRWLECASTLEEMRSRLAQLESNEMIAPVPVAEEHASIQLSRRGQVLRLSRRGDSTPQIASALAISQGEVKLTLKMQNLMFATLSLENA